MFTDNDDMFFAGGFMWIFWIILIVVLVLVVRSLAGNNNTSDSTMEILKRRYARGEIDEQEFERRRKELES